METPEKFATEAESIFRKWVKGTFDILIQNIDDLDVKDSEDLRKSLNSRVVEIGRGYLQGEFSFEEHGRFQDMGAGRKRLSESTVDRKGRKLKVRKPKKWYSRPFYGRINDLQGVMGYELMESAVETIKSELK
jgi:hypothetical protein